MRDSVYTLDIWGGCNCRDIFGFCNDNGVEVGEYAHCNTPITQFQSHSREKLDIEDFEGIDLHPYVNRWICRAFNGTALDYLRDSGSEWIMVDMHSFTFPNYRIEMESGDSTYVTLHREVHLNAVKKALENHGYNYQVERVFFPMSEYLKVLDKAYAFLKERYGDKIILTEVREATHSIDEEGNITPNEIDEEAAYLEGVAESYFMKISGCFVIRCPHNILSSTTHKWGYHQTHYIRNYYDYAKSVSDFIISSDNPSQKVLESMYQDFTDLNQWIRASSKMLPSRICSDYGRERVPWSR